MDLQVMADTYRASAQNLAAILKESIAIGPDDVDGIGRIPPNQMKAALGEMCRTLTYMEHDKVLYDRILEARSECKPLVEDYLKKTGFNVDELFARFLQFEQAVIKEADINYDCGRIMMAAIKSKRALLLEAFSNPSLVDVGWIKDNIGVIRSEVCLVEKEFSPTKRKVGAFVWGRLMLIAGVEIGVNTLANIGVLRLSPGLAGMPLEVGSSMSVIAGAILAGISPDTAK